MSGAPARRLVVRALLERGVTLTRACAAVEISRSSFRYESRRTDDVELIERIREIKLKKPRWGYKRIYRKLRGEGFAVNHKRIERIWREYGFTLPPTPSRWVRRSYSCARMARHSRCIECSLRSRSHRSMKPASIKTGQVLFAVPAGASSEDFKLQVQTGAFGTQTGEIALRK